MEGSIPDLATFTTLQRSHIAEIHFEKDYYSVDLASPGYGNQKKTVI